MRGLLVVDKGFAEGPVYVCRACQRPADLVVAETEAVRERTPADRSVGMACWACRRSFTSLRTEGLSEGEGLRVEKAVFLHMGPRTARGRAIRELRLCGGRVRLRAAAGYSWEDQARELRAAAADLRRAGPAPLPG